MADETGKTVEATLRILIDDADAKRKQRELKTDFEKIYAAAAMSDWRRRNAVERRKDAEEESRSRKKSHAEEMGHARSLKLMVQTRRKEEHEIDQARRRSLAYNVREGKKAAREARNEQDAIDRMNEASHRKSLALRVRQGRDAMADAERAAARQQGARGSLAMQSLALMQAGGVAGHIGRFQTFGNLLTTGFGGPPGGPPPGGVGGFLGRFGGGLTSNAMSLGVGAAAGAGIWSGVKAGARSEINPWADNRQQGSLALQGMFPNVYDTITLLNGTQRENVRANVAGDIGGMRLGGDVAAAGAARQQRSISDRYFLQNEAYKHYNVAGLPTADRTTALGQVQYGEQLRLQPAIQAQRKAEVELHAARMKSASATVMSKQVEEQYNEELRKGHRLYAMGMKMEGGIGSGADANAQKTLTLREASGHYAAADTLRGELKQKKLEEQAAQAAVVTAESGVRSASLTTAKGKLENLVAREQQATGLATSLGGMGPGGRMKGELALQMISENGIEFATPDMIAAAESVAPMTVRNMKRAMGEKYAGGSDILNRYAPDEYKDFGHAGELRKQVDIARGEVAELEVGNEKQTAAQYADVYGLKWAVLMMDLALQAAKSQIEQYKLDGMMGVQNQVAGQTKP